MKSDVKLVSKSGDIGSGRLDWDFSNGSVVMLTSPGDYILQAIFKALISPPNVSGYGVGVGSFRGTKHTVPMKVAVAFRLMQSINLLQKWYNRVITISDFGVEFGSPNDTIVISVDIGLNKGEIYYAG